MNNEYAWVWWVVEGIGGITFLLIVWGILIEPFWNVWASHKQGQADLQRAKNEQQIQIAEAQSRLDAAELNKKAEIIEAEAVAAQVRAIGTELTQHDLYLKWQWIKMMEDCHNESGGATTIYVPTEANIPVLEATRMDSERNRLINRLQKRIEEEKKS